MNERLERQLVARARRGDQTAFAELVQHFRPFVWWATDSYYGPGLDRQDLIQEGNIGLHAAVSGYKPPGRFQPFARLCIQRAVIDAVKGSTRQKHRPLARPLGFDAPVTQDGPPLSEALPAPGPDLADLVDQADVLRNLGAYVGELSRIERIALAGTLSGHSYVDTARRHGTSKKAIDNALQRARRKAVLHMSAQAAAPAPASPFDRQAELLETIHRCARELRQLAGDALVITIEPAKANGKPKARPAAASSRNGNGGGNAAKGAINREIGERNRREVLAIFQASPGEWLAPREVAPQTSISRQAVGKQIKRLYEAGAIEHNGRQKNAVRYRLPAAQVDDGHDPEPAPSELPHGLSPRTQKSIERAEQEAAEANGGGQAVAPPASHERVLASLRDEAGTVTELAMRTGLPRRTVAQAIEELRDQGRVLECGIRPPRGHKVYGVAE